MRASHTSISYAMAEKIELRSTPRIAKIAEKPSTKNTLLRNISFRLASELSSEEPARYAKNPGIIGNTHGERKDTRPAKNATAIVMSSIILYSTILKK